MRVLASEAVKEPQQRSIESESVHQPLKRCFTSVQAALAISKPPRQLVPASTVKVRSSVMELQSDLQHPPQEDFIMGINAEFSGGGWLLMTERAKQPAIMFSFEINNKWQETLFLTSARLPNVYLQVLPSH